MRTLGFDDAAIFTPYDVVDNNYFATQSDAVREDATAWRDRLGLGEGDHFLYVGRLAPEKDLQLLLRAYSKYRRQVERPWGLVVAGDGPMGDELRALAAELGIDGIHWLGYRQLGDLPACYALSSCLVLPSRSEPWGLVVNEAMASGLPVIVSSRCGCAGDLVRDRNGFIFEGGNEDALVRRLVDVDALSPAVLDEMGQASRAIVASYSPEVWASGLVEAARQAAR